MLFILNRSMEIVGSLNYKGNMSVVTPYFDDEYLQDLSTGAETFKFSTLGNSLEAQHIVVGNFIAFRYKKDYKLFNIISVDEEHDESLIKNVYCEMASIELINEIVRPMKFSGTVRAFLESILEETTWSVGIIDIGFNQTLDLDLSEYKSVYSLIQEHIVNSFSGEVSYRVEIENNQIVNKFVDVYIKRGTDKGLRFAYSKNLTSIKRTIDTSDLATALIGVGKNNITFKEIETEDKPLGQDFITNEYAYKLWNVNGSHVIGVHKEETNSPHELLRLTRKALEERSTPKFKYEVGVELLGEDVEIGETVKIVDHEFNPPIYLEGRVNQLIISQTDPEKNQCVLANFKELGTNISSELKELAGYIDAQFPIGGDKIQDGAINGDKLANGQIIQGTHLFANSITADKIKAGEIKTEHLETGSVTADKVTTGELITNSAQIGKAIVDSVHIKEGTIDTVHINDGSITSAKIGDAQIGTAQIKDAEITVAKIQDAFVDNLVANQGKFQSAHIGKLTSDNIDADTIKAEHISASVIDAINLNVEGKISAERIDVSSLTVEEIDAGKITTGDLNADRIKASVVSAVNLSTEEATINSAKIGNLTADKISGSVIEAINLSVSGKISADKIDVDSIKVNEIDAGKITSGYLSSDRIKAGTITAEKINSEAISTIELGASSIVADKISSGEIKVTDANIIDGTISGAKITKASIGNAQIEEAFVADAYIKNITADKIKGGTLDAKNITVKNLSADSITVGKINGQQIASGAISSDKLDELLSGTIKNTVDNVDQALTDIGLIRKDVENIEIGGRNLLINSENLYLSGTDYLSVTKREKGKITIVTTGRFNAYMWLYNEDISLSSYLSKKVKELCSPIGKEVTFSLDIKTTGLTKSGIFAQMDFRSDGTVNKDRASFNILPNKNGEWVRYSATIKSTNINSVRSLLSIYSEDASIDLTGVVIEYRNCMIEESNKASAYSKAPEDVDSAIDSVTEIANGKNTIIYSASQPSTTGRKVNDIWYNTSDGYKMYYFDGSKWVLAQFGTNAINTGAITADKVATNAITAGKISAGAVTTEKLYSLSVTADKIATNAITAGKISANAITAGNISVNAITTEKIATSAITADKLDVDNLFVGENAFIKSLKAVEIDASNITTGKISGERIDISGLVSFEALDETLNGVFKPVYNSNGVVEKTYINGGMISTGTVSADKIDIYSGLSVQKNGITTFAISQDGSVQMDGTLQSSNFDSEKNLGYQITPEGTAVFNQAKIKGDVELPNAGMTNYGAPKGNENLLLNSSFRESKDGWGTTSNSNIVYEDGYKCLKTVSSTLKTNYNNSQSILPVIKNGKTYTISAWVKTKNIVKGTTNYFVAFYVDGYYDKDGVSTWYGYGSVNFPINNSDWELVKLTFTADSKINTATSSNFYLYARDFTGTILVRDVKLEEGSEVTPWCPHKNEQRNYTRIWAGASYNDRDIAPFRVQQDGSLFANNGTFSGTMYGQIENENLHISNGVLTISNETKTLMDDGSVLSFQPRALSENVKLASNECIFDTDIKLGGGKIVYSKGSNRLNMKETELSVEGYQADITFNTENGVYGGLNIIGCSQGHHVLRGSTVPDKSGALIFDSEGNQGQRGDFSFTRKNYGEKCRVDIDGDLSINEKITSQIQKIEMRSVKNSTWEGWGFYAT